MKKRIKYHLEIEIDRLTNSIVNTISGDNFPADVHPATKADLKNTTKSNGWLFNWTTEFKQTDRQVFKLTIRNNPEIVQGLLSISDYNDHCYLNAMKFNLPLNSALRKPVVEHVGYRRFIQHRIKSHLPERSCV